MAAKIMNFIAFHLSIVIIYFSFGLLKPNLKEEPLTSNNAFKKSEISMDIDENMDQENRD